jgi:hypothetical protein
MDIQALRWVMEDSYIKGRRLLHHQVQVLDNMRRQLQQQRENKDTVSQQICNPISRKQISRQTQRLMHNNNIL